jgi:hypothetical protein
LRSRRSSVSSSTSMSDGYASASAAAAAALAAALVLRARLELNMAFLCWCGVWANRKVAWPTELCDTASSRNCRVALTKGTRRKRKNGRR